MKISREKVRTILLDNGFKLKVQEDGKEDLNAYVYAAINKVLEEVGSGVEGSSPKCCIIVAYDAVSKYIGDDNKLPWKLPTDLRMFKNLTHGKPIVMGRNTCESLGSRPLPGRTNIVVTRDPSFCPKGFVAFNSLDNALAFAESVAANNSKDEYFVIGGAQIYAQAIPKAERIYATEVESGLSGKCLFPAIHSEEWDSMIVGYVTTEEFPYTIITYDRKKAV